LARGDPVNAAGKRLPGGAHAWLGLAAVSLALHAAVLAAADMWVRPHGSSLGQGTPMKDAVRVTLVPLPVVEVALGTLKPMSASAETLSRTAPIELMPAAAIEPVILAAAPTATTLQVPLQVPLPDPAQAYHRLGELTKRPMLLTPVELLVNAPATAAQPGRMRIRLLISPHGRIDEVVIDNSSLTSLLRDEVIARFANAIYEPGEIDGTPVPSQVTIEIRS
jgi:Gram-negative bacterial TonB protein C-terminal